MPHIHDKPGQVDCTVTMLLFRKRAGELETMLHMHKKLGGVVAYRRSCRIGRNSVASSGA